MPLRGKPWWAQAVDALRVRSLASVAADFKADEGDLRASLVAAGAKVAADRAPWWPEAMRLRTFLSIRAIARLFDTEPRRVRRGLARTGERVHGKEIAGRGVFRLQGQRIGHRPDAEVARSIGLIPEAVQGERRLRGVAPFRPRPSLRLTEAEEEWVRGPVRGHRIKMDMDAPVQVIRRPVRVPGQSLPSAATAPRAAPGVGAPDPQTEVDPLLRPVAPREGRTRLVRVDQPVRVVVEEPPPRRRREPSARPEVRRIAIPEEPPAPTPAHVPAEVAWRVEIPGEDAAFVVRAVDLVGAVAAAARVLPPAVLQIAAVERIG